MVKKLLLLGFGLVLLIGLPLTIFVLQNQSQTTTTSGAAPVTKFSFSGPVTATTGQSFDENLVVYPGGSNQVSFVKFAFTYDQTKLTTASTPVTINTSTYTILEQPAVNCSNNQCTVTGTISIGSNQNAVIKSTTTIATVHFTATAATDTNGTQLAFVSGQNQALSVASTDQAAENVFQSGTPLTVVISDANSGSNPTATPTTSADITPTGTTDTGNNDGNTGGNTSGSGNTTGGTSGTNTTVSCTSFTADQTSGNPPLTVTFTTVGTSATDSISEIDLTYGDGTTDTVATGSGIGTGDVNNQITHTYSNAGTFTASAKLLTAGGASSDPSTCTQQITVGTQLASQNASPTPITKLPPTGPGETFMLIGGAGILVSVIGLGIVVGL